MRKSIWKEREPRLRELWHGGVSVEDIAAEFDTSRGAVYVYANKFELERRSARRGKKTRKPLGKPDGARIILDPRHPPAAEGRTIHYRTVVDAAKAKNMLKSGLHSRKIGETALKGHWKGFPLFTLTLEERATCPRSCKEWLTCYGNNLGHVSIERIREDDYLELRLHAAIAHLAALHPSGFAVRLHVLGDFFSVDYVTFWREMLREFPALHIFGFTARQPEDEDGIGRAIGNLMIAFEGRAMIRVSGGGQAMMCSEVVERAEDATEKFIVCPAERIDNVNCARCGICWTSARSITFLRH